MAGQFEAPITIRQAMRNIDDRSFLLPAIQRNFVWSTQQICTLFDSMMRRYPISTFMLWDVSSKAIKDKYRFYSFLSDYCEWFNESNELVATQGDFKDFKAVIDGQQRLTSIYVGLKGSYAYKRKHARWPTTRTDEALPPRKLYLNLRAPCPPEQAEAMCHFDFRFLTQDDVQALAADPHAHWMRVGEVLNLPDVAPAPSFPGGAGDDGDGDAGDGADPAIAAAVQPYLQAQGLGQHAFARATLARLYALVRHDAVIHFYTERSQEIDHVLDVFIRTNSGGAPLAFSDLLMSIAIAHWDGDARQAIDDVVTEVHQSAEMQFSIGRDWVLKACLMLTGADVRFRVKNFDTEQVATIQAQWPQLRACIVATFKMLRHMGLRNESLRAKNAALVLACYLYRQRYNGQPLFASIHNLNVLREERQALSQWLHMALLRGVFGGQADGVLSKMQGLIDKHLHLGRFPLPEVVQAFTATNKDLHFDGAFLKSLLDIQHGDARCRSVLGLLFPEINENLQLDIDHLHPQSAFTPTALQQHAFLREDPALHAFYADAAHWNSLANLHLLHASQNRSKQQLSLHDWMAEGRHGIAPGDLLLQPSDSVRFEDFPAFYAARRAALLQRLRANVWLSEAVDAGETGDAGPEVAHVPHAALAAA